MSTSDRNPGWAEMNESMLVVPRKAIRDVPQLAVDRLRVAAMPPRRPSSAVDASRRSLPRITDIARL